MVGVVRIFRDSAQAMLFGLVWFFPSRCQRVPPMENHNLHLQASRLCDSHFQAYLLTEPHLRFAAVLCQARTIRNPYPQMASRSVVFHFL